MLEERHKILFRIGYDQFMSIGDHSEDSLQEKRHIERAYSKEGLTPDGASHVEHL